MAKRKGTGARSRGGITRPVPSGEKYEARTSRSVTEGLKTSQSSFHTNSAPTRNGRVFLTAFYVAIATEGIR